MGGPGILATVAKYQSLHKVDLPAVRILVDVGAYHLELRAAAYHESDSYNSAEYIKNRLQSKFKGHDVEYFFDSDGNMEKYQTSMKRRQRSLDLDKAETMVKEMEALAQEGRCTKSVYQECTRIFESATPVSFDLKLAIADALRAQGETVHFGAGEADLAFLEYQVNDLLTMSGLSRAQFTALGSVSNTDYTSNLPGLGISKNTRIIKSISNGTDSVMTILSRYDQNNEVRAARLVYESTAPPLKEVNFAASRRIYIQGEETPLSQRQRDLKRLTEYQMMVRVNELKNRMLAAGKNQRRDSKEFNRSKAPPSASPVSSTTQRNPCNTITTRVADCKKEYMDRGFGSMTSKRYGIQVRMIKDPLDSDEGAVVPEGLEFKPFRAYPSTDRIESKSPAPWTPHTSKPDPLSKANVVKSFTGFHQLITLSVGQLGTNDRHAVQPQKLLTAISIEDKRRMAENAQTATIETARRIVRVSNELMRHEKNAETNTEANNSGCNEVSLEEDGQRASGDEDNCYEEGDNEESAQHLGDSGENDLNGQTGTKGDHHRFFETLLGYLRNPYKQTGSTSRQ
ncbi:hypothetical protein BGX31_004632 [Mortierella sp. GBA43]|nr:hypothetical protein BGX31_004632 [Mortierella sp. GBA43]